MNKKGLTLTIIFEAQSLNYDEGFGNLSTLKKLRRGSGDIYTFASRQSLRYSIVKQGTEQFGWRLGEVPTSSQEEYEKLDISTEKMKGEVSTSSQKENKTQQEQKQQEKSKEKVVQFTENTTIKDCEEIDLFGYMKTEQKQISKTRTAVVRLTPAISLEPFWNDIEFLTNKWLADRAKVDPNIANIEQHRSLYKYTITIDLDRIGTEKWNETLKDKNIEIDATEKAKRINEFLEVIKTLYRDIRGRREDLKPLFLIGGLYEIKNPFFLNAVKIEWDKNKPKICKEPIKEILDLKYEYKNNEEIGNPTVKDNTRIGIRSGFFSNEDEIKGLLNGNNNDVGTPEEIIDKLKTEIKEVFGVKTNEQSSSQN